MGLSDDHEGIIDLPADAVIGQSYVDYAGLDDPVIEIALTPDRGDCAGVRKAAAQCSASAPASDGRGVVGVEEDGCKVGARGV